MALPISPTPVIRGNDSKKFNAQLKKSAKKRISKKDRQRGIELVNAILSKATI
jgi:hypothetical protein